MGAIFGRLTVTGEVVLRRRSDGRNRASYPVKCECGHELEVSAGNLTSGNSRSCGCLHRELASSANTVHGASRDDDRLYRIWKGMRQRCTNPAASRFRWYGAKGVSVCAAWDEYVTFRDWALGHGYTASLTIERIDPTGNYDPMNCEWVTGAENARRAQLHKARQRHG